MSGLNFLLKSFPKEEKDEAGKLVGPSLKGVLQRERIRLTKEKKKKPKTIPKTFNPSLITFGYCKRLKVAQLADVVTLYRDVPAPKQQLMFDIGHKLHDIVQGYFWDIGILEGNFYCYKCYKEWWDTSPKIHKECGTKSRKLLRYNEVVLKDQEHLMSGRADGILHLPVEKETERHLVDIKTIANQPSYSGPNQFFFEHLKDEGAKQAHIIQLNLYMWMSKIHKGHLLYLAKQSHQLESFYFEYTPGLIQPYLDDIKEVMELARKVKGEEIELPEMCDNDKCDCRKL